MHNREQLTSTEAAAQLGVHVATVNRWAQDGTLPPAQKFPGLRGPNLFDRRDVELLKLRRERARDELAGAKSA